MFVPCGLSVSLTFCLAGSPVKVVCLLCSFMIFFKLEQDELLVESYHSVLVMVSELDYVPAHRK